MSEWLQNLPDLSGITIDAYLNHSYSADFTQQVPLFRWDNYLSIYLELFGTAVSQCHFATHKDGDTPRLAGVLNHELWDLPGNMEFWLQRPRAPWIMNIDLDYFFWKDPDETEVMVSDDYIETCFRPVRRLINDGTIAVTTLCLTPHATFTGGWASSERLAAKVLKVLGIEFALPDVTNASEGAIS